jgi:hypothetical protein
MHRYSSAAFLSFNPENIFFRKSSIGPRRQKLFGQPAGFTHKAFSRIEWLKWICWNPGKTRRYLWDSNARQGFWFQPRWRHSDSWMTWIVSFKVSGCFANLRIFSKSWWTSGSATQIEDHQIMIFSMYLDQRDDQKVGKMQGCSQSWFEQCSATKTLTPFHGSTCLPKLSILSEREAKDTSLIGRSMSELGESSRQICSWERISLISIQVHKGLHMMQRCRNETGRTFWSTVIGVSILVTQLSIDIKSVISRNANGSSGIANSEDFFFGH